MQVSVEKLSNIERRLTIVVPANEIEVAISKQIDQFAKRAKIDGFRPGKAPLTVIQQRYGDDARREAINQVIESSLIEALTEQKLRPVNAPRVEPKLVAPNQPFEFVATFEIYPEVGDVKLALSNLEKAVVDVSGEDVDKVVDQLRKQYTSWQLVDRAAAEGDRVVLDYYAVYEGKEELENKIENFPLELGSKKMLPGFEEGLLGAKAGDERKLSLTFPKDFQVTERAGKPIDFVIQVKQVFAADAPALDQAFVQRLGIKNGDEKELKQQIQQSLEQERDRVVKEKLKEQIFRQLLEQNPLEVPQSMVAKEAKHIHDEIYQNQHHDHAQHSSDEMTTFNEMAKKRVTLGILIAEYAKQHKLTADKARVTQRIVEIASAYEKPQEVIEWLAADERRNGIEAQVMEDQVMEKLMDGVAVIEKKMSYAELKGI